MPRWTPLEQRFWAKVERGPGCWPWLGSRFTDGYGRIKDGGRTLHAHRVAWSLARGPIPDGAKVLHKCDNPPCVNPSHLYVGTSKDNALDMHERGRANQRRASNNGAKLTEGEVAEILMTAGTQREIAVRFGISQPNVSMIRSGKRWSS